MSELIVFYYVGLFVFSLIGLSVVRQQRLLREQKAVMQRTNQMLARHMRRKRIR